MKVILVIDMPESCEECPFCDDFYYCIPEKAKGYVAFTEKSGRQEWCPLKPMPSDYPPYEKTIKQNFYTEEEFDAYEKGWNDCIEELEK